MDFDRELHNCLARTLKEPETPPNLAESIKYSLLAVGKRIRPRLMFACAEMLGLSERTVLPAAIALEMVHCFTLIHDDLPCMDNDDFRRGLPSNHKKFGEAVALLAGDALLSLAMEVFADSGTLVSNVNFIAALKRFCLATGPKGVIGGQAAEMLLTPKATLKDLERLHEMKTGALFAAALLIPKDLAGISDSSPEGEAIRGFASELGFSFQVADDFSDIEKDSGSQVSILFYLSQDEARELTLKRLTVATKKLFSLWGERANPLINISKEVTKSLI